MTRTGLIKKLEQLEKQIDMALIHFPDSFIVDETTVPDPELREILQILGPVRYDQTFAEKLDTDEKVQAAKRISSVLARMDEYYEIHQPE